MLGDSHPGKTLGQVVLQTAQDGVNSRSI
jgi:hypothetical protein